MIRLVFSFLVLVFVFCSFGCESKQSGIILSDESAEWLTLFRYEIDLQVGPDNWEILGELMVISQSEISPKDLSQKIIDFSKNDPEVAKSLVRAVSVVPDDGYGLFEVVKNLSNPCEIYIGRLSLLEYSVASSMQEQVEYLLEQGCDPNVLIYDTFPLLTTAITNNDEEIVRILCRFGADPDMKSVYEKSPRWNAGEMDNEWLLDAP